MAVTHAPITGYALYWENAGGKLADYEAIAEIDRTGTQTSYGMRKNTYIPPEATVLMAYGMIDSTETDDYAVYAIPSAKKFTSKTPISKFEVVSDIHINQWEENFANFQKALADIKATAPDSSAVFSNGDNVDYSNDTLYQNFADIFNAAKSGLPSFYFVIGGHKFFETITTYTHDDAQQQYSCDEKS